MVSAGTIFRWVSEVIFRSIFAGDDTPFKHSTLLINTPLVVTQILLASRGSTGVALTMVSLMVVHLMAGTSEALAYALVMTSLPAVWYFLTTLPFTASLTISAVISLRVIAVGSALLTFIYFLNPLELSVLAHKLGLKNVSLYPAMTWKVTPHVMRDMKSAMLSAELKGEKLWKALAVTILAVNEYSSMYEEGTYVRMRDFKPRYWYDGKAILIFALILAVDIIALLLLYLRIISA